MDQPQPYKHAQPIPTPTPHQTLICSHTLLQAESQRHPPTPALAPRESRKHIETGMPTHTYAYTYTTTAETHKATHTHILCTHKERVACLPPPTSRVMVPLATSATVPGL